MDINGVSSSKVLKFYNNNSSKNIKENNAKPSANDSLEISNLGKKLSEYSIDDNFSSPTDRINVIKEHIKNGTYDMNSNLVAQGIINYIKGKGV